MKRIAALVTFGALLLNPFFAMAQTPSNTTQADEQATVMSLGVTTERSSLGVTSDYLLGPQDVLEITVWRSADLSKVVQVRPDGKISLPLIGDVAAMGLDPTGYRDLVAGSG